MRNAYEAQRFADLIEAGQRTVKTYTCKCGAPCLKGEDDDRCAATARVDIEPIDRLAETLAILDGRETYDICKPTGKNMKPNTFILYIRSWWHYKNTDRKYPVLVAHRCERQSS